MTMTSKGIAKALEEVSELQIELGALGQVLAKKLARMDTDFHWDGAGSLNERIENEIADVAAASFFLIGSLQLDQGRISERMNKKVDQFNDWEKLP